MKRYALIIGLWAAGIALPNEVWAQWDEAIYTTNTGLLR
jgi:hypothetical protein